MKFEKKKKKNSEKLIAAVGCFHNLVSVASAISVAVSSSATSTVTSATAAVATATSAVAITSSSTATSTSTVATSAATVGSVRPFFFNDFVGEVVLRINVAERRFCGFEGSITPDV